MYVTEEVLMFQNFDLESIVTPVNYTKLETLLKQAKYNASKTKFLIEGFKNGFDIGYAGPENIQRRAPNLKLRVGNETILWNKVMKEVRDGRFAGPFLQPPFDNFIQSPIGLVPKDNGVNTRLIFHLSYPRDGQSVNSCTPTELCSVKYPSFDEAITRCMEELQLVENETDTPIFIGKSDMRMAFRNLGLNRRSFKFLVMKARCPLDHNWYYFVDKCLPFGASISCALFQEFSNCIAHLMKFRTDRQTVNYLDDYLFACYLRSLCDDQIKQFLSLCSEINFPVSLEKTEWASTRVTFLGLLIDTILKLVCVPTDKIQKAKSAILSILDSKKRKVTVHKIESLCGYLNFLCKCVVPGRAFTRRLYAITGMQLGKDGQRFKLKQHHHVKLSQENICDLQI